MSEVADIKGIPKQTLSRWIKLHGRIGEEGLENNKPGARETEINPKFENLILGEWNKRKRSAHKL